MGNREGYFPRSARNLSEVIGENAVTAWTIIDSNYSSYEKDFKIVDKDNKIPALIKRLQQKEDPVVVDLMSSTHALSSMRRKYFRNHPRAKFIAVGAEEVRTPEAQEEDAASNITFITDDINKSRTWARLDDALEGKKADFIMERSYGGLHFISNRGIFYQPVMGKIWDRLSPDGGITCLQTPNNIMFWANDVDISGWIEKVDEAGIYNRSLAQYESFDSLPYGMVLLEKESDSQQLPLLLSP